MMILLVKKVLGSFASLRVHFGGLRGSRGSAAPCAAKVSCPLELWALPMPGSLRSRCSVSRITATDRQFTTIS
jgi:hypothetical protein